MPHTWLPEDARWMRVALAHGARHIGQCEPNTSVGCVLVKDGQLLAAATTGIGGRPHAEAQALHAAGEKVRGATAYVTLEPCAHHGKTPPCADALIAAGIARVVVAMTDPDERVAGQGIEKMKAVGIPVAMATAEWQLRAAEQHRGFLRHRQAKLPYIALKIATGLDGAVASPSGESQWITGEASRRHAQGLRARYDAILTGSGTMLADDPKLTCRIPGMENNSPIRVLLDTRLRIPPNAALLDDLPRTKLWIFTAAETMAAQTHKVEHLREMGAEILPCRSEGNHLDLGDIALRLGQRGITRLLIEAGPGLTASFLESGLVERVYWYRAPILLGQGARHGMQPQLAKHLSDLPKWRCEQRVSLGGDQLEILAVPTFAPQLAN